MNVKDVDYNFKLSYVNRDDIDWIDANEIQNSLFGLFYSKEENLYRRMPKNIAEKVSQGVDFLSTHTAGGRLRFITNSPFVAIKCYEPYCEPMSHITFVGMFGLSVFADREYVGMVTPNMHEMLNIEDTNIVFDGIKYVSKESYLATIFFPLYSSVSKVYIGVQKGSYIKEPTPYAHSQKVLFYGSSITQGGCASKPGDDYIGRLSKSLDVDIINLGFSGNAMGEPLMAEYISSLSPDIFVYDYDANAPDVNHLKNTHYNFYKIIRNKLNNTPIIMMTKPTYNGKTDIERYDVIYQTYQRAKEEGDNNVYFLSGDGLLGDSYMQCGSVDGNHPNDLGFYFMEQALLPILKKVIK